MTVENRKLSEIQKLKKNNENSLDPKPLITVITSVFNGEKHLEETILSVINQSYNNIEYIIVDGGSTDGTIDIIKKYEERINRWSSEKDMGIYFGFNRGLAQARGDMIGFVNADDVLHDDAISMLVRYYNKYPKIDFIFGSVKKHWGILHGYKPWKIFFSWGFYTSHSTEFL